MKKTLALAISITFAIHADAKVLMQFSFEGCKVQLLDSSEAAQAIQQPDKYSNALTPFDLQIRLGGQSDISQNAYLQFAAHQVQSWTDTEQANIKSAFAAMEALLQSGNIHLKVPVTIKVIKTTGEEELGAEGYTRNNNIMLHINSDSELNVHLIAHEFFHVYSRYNTAMRDKIYALFGFHKCNVVSTGEAMQHRVITNPDCPVTEHYITLDVDSSQQDFVLQLYSKHDYNKDYNLGDYMALGLLEVDDENGKVVPVMKDGKGVVYDVDAIPDLFKHIGTNTPYILHPEEISAEHFALWLSHADVPQPEYFDAMKKALQEQ